MSTMCIQPYFLFANLYFTWSTLANKTRKHHLYGIDEKRDTFSSCSMFQRIREFKYSFEKFSSNWTVIKSYESFGCYFGVMQSVDLNLEQTFSMCTMREPIEHDTLHSTLDDSRVDAESECDRKMFNNHQWISGCSDSFSDINRSKNSNLWVNIRQPISNCSSVKACNSFFSLVK